MKQTEETVEDTWKEKKNCKESYQYLDKQIETEADATANSERWRETDRQDEFICGTRGSSKLKTL